ncbi:HAMP domain-containing sensor histidine kinase [Pseudolactococcus yaeyamensis]
MAMKKSYGLYRLLTKFIVTLVIGLILSLMIPLLLFLMSEKLGYVKPANAGETAAEALVMKIQKEQAFDSAWLSSQNQYVRLNQNYELIGSSMDKALQQAAIQAVKAGEVGGGNFIQTRLGTDYIVLSYQLKSSYTNDFINNHFLSPEVLIIVGIITILSLTVILSIRRFTRVIRHNLTPMTRAVKHIQNNELDFTVGSSKITEFNEVLESFKELKNSLREALQKRWQSEENQRNQLAALVHDVKTPLTGAVGWGDLLAETQLTSEQASYLKKLQASTATIEQLVNDLLQVTRDSNAVVQNISQVNLIELVSELAQSLMPVIEVKHISFETIFELKNENVTLDAFLLTQALKNIISNAVDFVAMNGIIKLTIHRNKQTLKIVIEDDGPSFSAELLEKAFTESYMGDSSRSGINHFGLGLTIAKRNIELIGGTIVLGKSATLGGASVVVMIPQ